MDSYKDYFSLAPHDEYNTGKLYTVVKGEPVQVALKRVDKPGKGASIMIGFFIGGELIQERDLLDCIGLPGLYKRKKDARNAGADQFIVNELLKDNNG